MSKYPDHLTPGGTPLKSNRSRSRREASGVFQLFQAPQIQQFKEAFSLIDQDGDGIVSEKDLKAIFANLGALYQFATTPLFLFLKGRRYQPKW